MNELIKPGWHRDMPDTQYHGGPGASSSNLKILLESSPAIYAHRKLNPKPSTPAMMLGTLVHAMLLQPETVETDFAIKPKFGRKKADLEDKAGWEAENMGKLIVSVADVNTAEAMTKSALEHETAGLLLLPDDTITESSVFWWYKGDDDADDRDYKELVKVRPDILSRGHPMIIDVKTTEDASFDGFSKSIVKFNYHLSAAMYLDGVNRCPEIVDQFGAPFIYFVFIVIEKSPPYQVAVYNLPPDAKALGWHLYRTAMRRLHDARLDGFPELPPEIRDIELPPWANKAAII